MSGDIYFGFDNSQKIREGRNDGYVNSPTFAAFGELLDEALEKTLPEQLEEIKEGQYQMLYSFCRLSAADYNAVIYALRNHVNSLQTPTEVQQRGIWVWQEMAEPFIRKDERYDFAFHGEIPPSQT